MASSSSSLSYGMRDITPHDLNAAAQILFQGFWEHNMSVGLQPSIDFPDLQSSTLCIQSLLSDPQAHGLVAVSSSLGEVIGVGFIIFGRKVNTITAVAAHPKAEGRGIGKAVMLALLQLSEKTEAVSIRLTQSATNMRSFALYASLDFRPVECWCNFAGSLHPEQAAAAAASANLNLHCFVVRPMEEKDVKICADLFNKALNYDRERELSNILSTRPKEVWVVTKSGLIEGFTTGFVRSGYTIATSEEACVALYCNASGYVFLTSLAQWYPRILKWALATKLPLLRNGWIMVRGEYQRPAAQGLVWAPGGLH